jgi:protein-S-isoprenylcysteine O-methyltransferase Ste14
VIFALGIYLECDGESMKKEYAIRWWHGTKGEWYVVGQLCMIVIVFFGPRTLGVLPVWPSAVAQFSAVGGVMLMVTGACLLLVGSAQLGSNLTPLPYPKSDTTFVQTGPYRFVRHPMYSGGIVLSYGWAFFVNGWLTLLYATALLVFLDVKADREERWLIDRFPEYCDYQKSVCKLIPFIY